MKRLHAPWRWIPSLYFAEGLPNVIVTFIALLMYKRLGLSNEDATFYTSWLYLPWVIKPFWSPVVDILHTKRWWILTMQLLIGASLAGVAFSLHCSPMVQWTLAFFWLLAFSSATHDIAADGFYMLQLTPREQSLYVGIRSTFYRVSTIAGQGLLLMVAGTLEVYTRSPLKAWSITFALSAAMFGLLYAYHKYYALPRPQSDTAATVNGRQMLKAFIDTFISFFRKPGVLAAIAFMLLFRLPEALLTKVCPLFLVDPISKGGLGLTTSEIGFAQGTLGVIGLMAGGILGGIVASRDGLKRWLWPMVAAISLPDILYVALAYFQPEVLHWAAACIFIEQFGYGFGFTAYMIYLMQYAQGPSKTAHYAFATGFMALSLMIPGLFAGWLSDLLGYLNFFILIIGLLPVTFIVSALIKVDDKR